jgi:hypothetical protein
MVTSDEDIKREMEFADELTSKLFDDIKEAGMDPADVMFSIWINLIHILAEAGWTPEELIRDIHYHAVSATDDIGPTQGDA